MDRFVLPRIIIGVHIAAILTGCASTPKKYRRVKDCDCPKWNQRIKPDERPMHANLRPVGTVLPPGSALI
jgi:hypothetical protein